MHSNARWCRQTQNLHEVADWDVENFVHPVTSVVVRMKNLVPKSVYYFLLLKYNMKNHPTIFDLFSSYAGTIDKNVEFAVCENKIFSRV